MCLWQIEILAMMATVAGWTPALKPTKNTVSVSFLTCRGQPLQTQSVQSHIVLTPSTLF